MNELLSMVNSYRIILGALAVLIVTTLLIRHYWDQVSFFWLRIWCAVPLVGKVASLARNSRSYDSEKKWFSSETDLCSHFIQHLEDREKASPGFFIKCQRYLNKVQETGRRNLPMVGWLLIIAMVFVEAMGFSYVLAGWTIPGASEALQQQGAIGIAFLISTLLVYLTHKTGHELHRNRLISKANAWSANRTQALIPDLKISLDNNDADDSAPNHQQLINRLDTNGTVSSSWVITTITAVFIVAIAIGATYVRGQALDEMLSSQQMSASSSPGDYEDPYSNTALPDELSDIQQAADQQAQQSMVDHQRKGGWGTFIVLACIFVFLQIMGIMLGFFTGFAGKESANARSYIGRFRSKEEFTAYHERQRNKVGHIAQKHLSSLQQKMLKKAQKHNIDGESTQLLLEASKRTFQAYAEEKEEEALTSRERYHHGQQRRARLQTDTSSATSDAPQHEVSKAAAPTEGDGENERREKIRRRLEAERARKDAEAKALKASRQQEDDDAYEARLRREMGLDDGETS